MKSATSYFPDARLVRPITLPASARKVHHYVNLTNGLEAVPHLTTILPPHQLHLCRLQSSHCEASRPDLLLRTLETSMLFQLAKGHCVLVYDFGSRNKKRGAPRALWMGIEFVRWTLDRVWFRRQRPAWVRGNNVENLFQELLDEKVDRATMKRIKYFRRYLADAENDGFEHPPETQLYGVYADTIHDHDDAYYDQMAEVLEQRLLDEDATAAVSRALEEALAREEPIDRRYGGSAVHPVENVLGMRLFLGGIDPETYAREYRDDGSGTSSH
jgi:hypothetical protein